MTSVRLYGYQIRRFPAGQGAAIIRYAVKRYRKGELVIQNTIHDGIPQNELQVFPLRQKPDGISDALLRQILDAHYATPIPELDRLIAQSDALIAAMLNQYTAQPYLLEDQQ